MKTSVASNCEVEGAFYVLSMSYHVAALSYIVLVLDRVADDEEIGKVFDGAREGLVAILSEGHFKGRITRGQADGISGFARKYLKALRQEFFEGGRDNDALNFDSSGRVVSEDLFHEKESASLDKMMFAQYFNQCFVAYADIYKPNCSAIRQ